MNAINLHLGDCMEAMRQIPDKAYDLAIVDPPYGINVNKFGFGRHKGKKLSYKRGESWDKSIPDDEYFIELQRISINQIIWGGNYFPLPLTKSWIYWNKGVPDGMSFAHGELAWTSFNIPLREARLRYSGCAGVGVYKSRIHPTQKPPELYKWVLKNYASPGNKILDTHFGSGSIAIACHDMGFSLDAWEIDQDYYQAAVKRYQQHIMQIKLFA